MKQGRFVGGPWDGEIVPFEYTDKPFVVAPVPEAEPARTPYADMLGYSAAVMLNTIRYRRVQVKSSRGWDFSGFAWFAAPGVSDADVVRRARLLFKEASK